MKFVDDMTIAEAINIKDKIVPHPNPNPVQPTTFHSRTGHYLPPESSHIHKEIARLQEYSSANQMKINVEKTKLMIFKAIDVHPVIEMDDKQLEIVESMKLLGVIVTSDMKWHQNTDFITQKGFSRLWILRRLKKLGLPKDELLDTYMKKVRSILEMAVPVWNPALSQSDSAKIERVQKAALRIILGKDNSSYYDSLQELELENLETRREELCKNFATKAYNHERHSQWFWSPTTRPNTRNKTECTPVWTRTSRFKKSPLPYLTDLLNG